MKRSLKRQVRRQSPVRKTRPSPSTAALTPAVMEERRAAGFRLGFDYGYSWGRSQAVLLQAPPQVTNIWDIRVLFVMSGKGVPYSPIDQAIYEALQANVRECAAISPVGPILELADQARPDLVLVLEGMELPVEVADGLRMRGIRTAVWFTDDPYYVDVTEKLAVHYDDVFTLELNCVPFYQSIGCPRVHYLPLGANPAVFRPQPVPTTYRRDVSFIGSAYWNRVSFVNSILPVLENSNSMISGWWWERLPSAKRLGQRLQSGVWLSPEETAKFYYGSRIVLNVHRAYDDESYNCNVRKIPAYSVNPRTFEIAASGAFQMTDERSDLLNFYTPGEEVVTFASPEECMEKIRHYLAHEDERREIALRGLRRTLSDHTYHKRIQSLLTSVFTD
ncbi:glycosyltransferase [Paenibacillus sp. YN15]|uniref:CgeB family protein n=1 Tax=Paenibacillus sp. YN15 TaxID=1742774 RepID=UPI00215B8889|nr:glycosyltransferase [Paenibacillus sp. YN15]